VGLRSVTSPSLRSVGTRFRTSSKSSVSFPGLGRYATITITPFIRLRSWVLLFVKGKQCYVGTNGRGHQHAIIRLCHCYQQSTKQFIQLGRFGAFAEKRETAVCLNVARGADDSPPRRRREPGPDGDATHSEIGDLGKRKLMIESGNEEVD